MFLFAGRKHLVFFNFHTNTIKHRNPYNFVRILKITMHFFRTPKVQDKHLFSTNRKT